jgi:predicted methyltransferase
MLSWYQTSDILKAKREGKSFALTSLNLGLTTVEATFDPAHVSFSDGTRMGWDCIEKINSNKNACFCIEGPALWPVRGFSETFGRAYSLLPTSCAPALILAGFPMHRIKDITPYQSSAAMVDAIAPFWGEVLDTATGLGYTAIEAAKTATHVSTVELDAMALEIARLNPWSCELFAQEKISQIIGDSSVVIREFQSEKFCGIIHDPPTISLAGDLYSGEFYRQALRVLKPGGKMFHYIGDPSSSAVSGATQGVIRRLKEAGFKNVSAKPLAFGITAQK